MYDIISYYRIYFREFNKYLGSFGFYLKDTFLYFYYCCFYIYLVYYIVIFLVYICYCYKGIGLFYNFFEEDLIEKIYCYKVC